METMGISFGLGIPWKNDWVTKGTAIQESLKPSALGRDGWRFAEVQYDPQASYSSLGL